MRARISSAELAVRSGFEARLSGLSAQLDHRDLVIEELLRQLRHASILAAAAGARDRRHEGLAARLAALAEDILNAERLVALRATVLPAPSPDGILAHGPATVQPAPPAPASDPASRCADRP